MGIEEYLKEKGYVKHIYNCKTGKLELPGEFTILSTMGNLDWRYVKEGCETVIYGLNEVGKPPVLIHPKPWSLIHKEFNGVTRFNISDDVIHRIFEKYSLDEIFESINE